MFDVTNDNQTQRLLIDLARLAAKYLDAKRDFAGVAGAVVSENVIANLTASPLSNIGATGADRMTTINAIGALGEVLTAIDSITPTDMAKIQAFVNDWGVRPFLGNR